MKPSFRASRPYIKASSSRWIKVTLFSPTIPTINIVIPPRSLCTVLFVGGPGTNSTVHNDLGGMTIFIVGMVGEKSVTLIHRDDEALMYGLEARKEGFMSSDDNQFYPLAHLARSWHHVVVPGDVLVMPPRTVSDNQTGLSKE